MDNRATQISVGACLRVMMNLTHSHAGSAMAAQHNALVSLTSIVHQLAISRSQNERTTPKRPKAQKGQAEGSVPHQWWPDECCGVKNMISFACTCPSMVSVACN
jgi:hypothetical protein